MRLALATEQKCDFCNEILQPKKGKNLFHRNGKPVWKVDGRKGHRECFNKIEGKS